MGKKDAQDINSDLKYKSKTGAEAVNQVLEDCFERTTKIRRDGHLTQEEKEKKLTNHFKRSCYPNYPDKSTHNFNIRLNTNVTMVHDDPLGFWKSRRYSLEICDKKFVEMPSYRGGGPPSYCQMFVLRRQQADCPDVCLPVLGEPINEGECPQDAIILSFHDFTQGAPKMTSSTSGEEGSKPSKAEPSKLPKAETDSDDDTCMFCELKDCTCRRRRLANLHQ